MENKERLFHFVYPTKEDLEKEKQETIANFKEEQKTEIVFNNEILYYLGRGHDFVRSFFEDYITKSGIEFRRYLYSNTWCTGDKEYEFTNNEWIDVTPEPVEYKPTDWSNFSFPAIKNIKPTTIASELKSYIPNNGKNKS